MKCLKPFCSVAVEIRAAEIAAAMIVYYCILRDTGADALINTPPAVHWETDEMAGWVRYGDSRDGLFPKSPGWQAGWLAARIWAEETGIDDPRENE